MFYTVYYSCLTWFVVVVVQFIVYDDTFLEKTTSHNTHRRVFRGHFRKMEVTAQKISYHKDPFKGDSLVNFCQWRCVLHDLLFVFDLIRCCCCAIHRLRWDLLREFPASACVCRVKNLPLRQVLHVFTRKLHTFDRLVKPTEVCKKRTKKSHFFHNRVNRITQKKNY